MTSFFSNMLSKGDEEQRNYETEISQRLEMLEKAVEESLQKADMLNTKLAEAEKKIEKLESRYCTERAENGSTEEVDKDHSANETTLHTSVATPSTYYFSAPTPDGYFTSPSLTEQNGTSIYMLTTDDGISGQFVMLNTKDAIATACISISQFVKPACKTGKDIAKVARSVTMIEPGLAVFDGEKWKISQKAIIEFNK